MKKSKFLEIVREEIQKQLREYGSESMYYSAPGGFEQIGSIPEIRVQHFEDYERWKVIAMQLGATIQDRGDDWLAILPNQDKLGTYSKRNFMGTLTLSN
jgi:hypothetical protein